MAKTSVEWTRPRRVVPRAAADGRRPPPTKTDPADAAASKTVALPPRSGQWQPAPATKDPCWALLRRGGIPPLSVINQISVFLFRSDDGEREKE